MARNFDTLLRDINPDGDGEESFVDRVVDAILESDDPASIIRPLLRPMLTGRYRARVRALEQGTTDWHVPQPTADDRYPGARRGGSANAALERRRVLLAERIHIPGSGAVAWGDATVPQLRDRITMLRSKKSGLEDTIRRLENAIEVIRAEPGAKCLNDIYRHAPATI